jgi:23S rRNA (uracil1939-C5)-methyltransferase
MSKSDHDIQPGDELTLEMDKLAYGGQGLGRHQGLVVFTARGLPGQKVRARVTALRRSFAEAEVLEIIEPSPHQVEAPCPDFGICGGCDWQDLEYGQQLAWKRIQIAENLERIAGISGETVAGCVPSPLRLGYRNKMEFAFQGRGKDLALGLRLRHDPGRVFDAGSCLLMPWPAMDILATARDFARASGVRAFDPRSGRGFWRFLVLRLTCLGEAMVHLVTSPGRKHEPMVTALAERLREAHPEVVSFVHGLRFKKTQVAQAQKLVWSQGRPHVREKLGGLEFQVGPSDFFQTNTRAAEELVSLVRAEAGLTGAERLLDLYCGVGVMGLCLASRAREVAGYEIVKQAVGSARQNALANNIGNADFVAGDLGATLEGNASSPDVVVTDPPRAGMAPEATRAMLDSRPERIVYVSCNPATLARDASRLAEGFSLARVTPVDLFPHTHHIECVALLQKK